MPRSRTYTDALLQEAIEKAASWGDVMEGIGKGRRQGRNAVLARARFLQLDTTHLDGVPKHERPVVPTEQHPFQGQEHFGAKGRTGLAIATKWFISRGYNVSLPVEPVAYDLISGSETGLKQVQVKTTSNKDSHGRALATLTRYIYDPSIKSNAHGSYRRAAYTPEEVDLFFLAVTHPEEVIYIIPIEYVGGKHQLTLDLKYAAFRVDTSYIRPA